VPNVRVRLRVTLKAAAADPPLSTSGDGAGGGEGSSGGGGIRELLLVSGPPAQINVEDGNWFNFKDPEKPLTVRVRRACTAPYRFGPDWPT
jgi:hypothetical protein